MTVDLPADRRYLRMARLVAAGWGSMMVSQRGWVDDLRLAVDELCTALLRVADGTRLVLDFARHENAVLVQGRTAGGPAASLDRTRFGMADRILQDVCDEYVVTVDDGVGRFSLQKRVTQPVLAA